MCTPGVTAVPAQRIVAAAWQIHGVALRIATTRSNTAAAIVRLSASGTTRGFDPTANRIVTALVSCWKPVAGAPHVVGDDQIEVLALELSRALATRSSVSAANPTRICPAGLLAPSPARMSGVGSRTISGTPSLLLELVRGRGLRTEVGDRRRHHHHVARRGAPCSHRRLHLGGGLDGHDGDAARNGQLDRGDERDVGAARRRPPRRARTPACPSCGWRSPGPHRSVRGCRRR